MGFDDDEKRSNRGSASNPSFCYNTFRPFSDETYAIAIYEFCFNQVFSRLLIWKT